MKRSFAYEESDISSSEVQDDVDFEYVEEDEIMEVFFVEHYNLQLQDSS